jgi:hypothetical protein
VPRLGLGLGLELVAAEAEVLRFGDVYLPLFITRQLITINYMREYMTRITMI